MKIDYALLADAAQAVGGKIFILGGGWNVFRAPNYPAMVPLAVAIGVSFAPNELGTKYPLAMVVADEAGVPIAPQVNFEIETGQIAPDVPTGVATKVPVAFNIGLMVPRPGRYGLVVSIGFSRAELLFEAIFHGQRVQFSPPTGAPERGN